MLRINGANLAGFRHNGRPAKIARLNGNVVWSAGVLQIDEEWNTIGSQWRLECDPGAAQAYPFSEGGFLRAGIPASFWSGAPGQSAYTVDEVDNTRGEWAVRIGAVLGKAGLYSGMILGCDAAAGRMLELVFDRNGIRLRYRTSRTNSWINLGSTSSFSLSPNAVISATRTVEAGGARVRAYQNGVQVGNWLDSSGIPGVNRHVGVRLQGNMGLISIADRSPHIAQFQFSTLF